MRVRQNLWTHLFIDSCLRRYPAPICGRWWGCFTVFESEAGRSGRGNVMRLWSREIAIKWGPKNFDSFDRKKLPGRQRLVLNSAKKRVMKDMAWDRSLTELQQMQERGGRVLWCCQINQAETCCRCASFPLASAELCYKHKGISPSLFIDAASTKSVRTHRRDFWYINTVYLVVFSCRLYNDLHLKFPKLGCFISHSFEVTPCKEVNRVYGAVFVQLFSNYLTLFSSFTLLLKFNFQSKRLILKANCLTRRRCFFRAGGRAE